jgi:serine protease inhibitor
MHQVKGTRKPAERTQKTWIHKSWTHSYWVGLVAIASCLILTVMGCGQTATGEDQPSGRVASPGTTPVQTVQTAQPAVNPKLIAANTQFGFKLFGQLVQKTPNQNVFISPSSIAIALAMTYNGASGTTQQAMAKALELKGLKLDDINQANANLKALLTTSDPQVQIAIANSLWTQQGLDLKPKFLERNRQFYNAQITALDFRNPQSPTQINTWVKEQTQGKISQIVETLSPSDRLILVNAIYFKGAWTQAFDPLDTTIELFYAPDGRFNNQPFMVQSGDYKYYETPDFQAVSLPYGKQSRLSLDIFVPKSGSSLAAFYQTLTAQNWQTWMSRFRTRAGAVRIPRFKLEYNIQLKPALSALGMGMAFDPANATFADLSAAATSIGQVRHKTFIDVNEAGTEAAGTTAVGIRTTSVPVNPPFKFIADHPFFCAIRDRQTGSILFMGSIVAP